MKNKKAGTSVAPLYTVLGSVNKNGDLNIRVIPLTKARISGNNWLYPAGDGTRYVPVENLNKIDASDFKNRKIQKKFFRGFCFKSRVSALISLLKQVHTKKVPASVIVKPVITPVVIKKVPAVKLAVIVKTPAVKIEPAKAPAAPAIAFVPKAKLSPIVTEDGRLMSNVDQADIEAVKAILAGNKEKFSIIYKRYYPIILQKMSAGLKFNNELAEDLTADIFLKVFENLDKYQVRYTFNSWITRVAKNYLLDYFRKKTNLELVSVSIDRGMLTDKMKNEGDDSRKFELPETKFLNPEEALVFRENKSKLLDAIDKLDEKSKMVVQKIFFEDAKYVDLAKESGIPLNSLLNMVFRIKAKLKTTMEKNAYVAVD
jgi:RNA polymerase sigma-70 factor (ECF subfamily)